eukprot:c13085_g1_i3.p1 GENE.c13085_g1_i3~~c13085_g1_i3.p1  ORF type:complete len:671 (+),score=133.91 c13085_g1_i3:205-2217(+)
MKTKLTDYNLDSQPPKSRQKLEGNFPAPRHQLGVDNNKCARDCNRIDFALRDSSNDRHHNSYSASQQSDHGDFTRATTVAIMTSNTPTGITSGRPNSTQSRTTRTNTSIERSPSRKDEFVKRNLVSRQPQKELSSEPVSDGDDFNASMPKRRKTTSRTLCGPPNTSCTTPPSSESTQLEPSGLRAFNGKQLWTAEEDRALFFVVSERGPRAWEKIANELPERSGKQCRERWFNHVAPCVSKKQWNKEEDKLIMHMVRKYGSKWAFISRLLPGRTDAAVKNRYSTFVRHNLAPRPDSWEIKSPLTVDSSLTSESPTLTTDPSSPNSELWPCSRPSTTKAATKSTTPVKWRKKQSTLSNSNSLDSAIVSSSSSFSSRSAKQVRLAVGHAGFGAHPCDSLVQVGVVSAARPQKRKRPQLETPMFDQIDNSNTLAQSTSHNLTSQTTNWPTTDESNHFVSPTTKPRLQVPGLGALTATGSAVTPTSMLTAVQYSNDGWGVSLQQQWQHQQQQQQQLESQPQHCLHLAQYETFPWQHDPTTKNYYNNNLHSQPIEQQQQQSRQRQHQCGTELKPHPIKPSHLNLFPCPSSTGNISNHSHNDPRRVKQVYGLELQIDQFKHQAVHQETDGAVSYSGPTNLLLLLARAAALEEPTQVHTTGNKVRLPSFAEQFGSIF